MNTGSGTLRYAGDECSSLFFLNRFSYTILAANEAKKHSEAKDSSIAVISNIGLEKDEYRFGSTKVDLLDRPLFGFLFFTLIFLRFLILCSTFHIENFPAATEIPFFFPSTGFLALNCVDLLMS